VFLFCGYFTCCFCVLSFLAEVTLDDGAFQWRAEDRVIRHSVIAALEDRPPSLIPPVPGEKIVTMVNS
jgi:hypothetical protein